MAAPQNFRSAFNGFNRDDVVNYISFLTTKHENQVNQLNSEIDQLRQELSECSELPAVDEAELTLLREQVAQLQEQLRQRDETIARLQHQASAMPIMSAAQPTGGSFTEQELNAYRRAEDAERRAMERVDRMYEKANGVIADTAARLEENSNLVAQLSDRVRGNLEALENAVAQSKNVLQDSATVISAIHPEG